MSDDLLDSVKGLGDSRSDICAVLTASPMAPKEGLTPSALGMWFTRGAVPKMWRPAVLDRLGRLEVREARPAEDEPTPAPDPGPSAVSPGKAA